MTQPATTETTMLLIVNNGVIVVMDSYKLPRQQNELSETIASMESRGYQSLTAAPGAPRRQSVMLSPDRYLLVPVAPTPSEDHTP